MADEEEEQRTELASQRRLESAFEEGNIAIARDVGMLATLAVGTAAIVSLAPGLRDALIRLVHATLDGLQNPFPNRLLPYLTKPIAILLAILVSVALAVIVVYGAQTRLGMWAHLAMPDFNRVFGGGGLKRLFQKDILIDLGISAAKVLTLGWMFWATFRATFMALPSMLQLGSGAQLEATYRPIAENAAKILTFILIIAGADFALVRYRYGKRMRMTKEEAKREYREESGDPALRNRRRRRHRELAMGQAKKEVPRADALIVNPTHIAIAIRYRSDRDPAPRVTAKGKGVLAETMRDLARANGIPIVEDIPLARLLFKRVKVGRCVPAETFKAVAAVLAYVYRVLGRNPMLAGGRG